MVREGTSLTPIPYTRKVFYDTLANLPVTGVMIGDLGYATDTTLLYRWSGAAWVAITALATATFAGLTDTQLVRKTADEVVNNNNTPQNDDHLLFAIGANEIWEFSFHLLIIQAVATADWKFSIVCPAGGQVYWADLLNWDGKSLTLYTSGGVREILNAVTTLTGLIIKGIAVNGATPGDIQLQWSQSVATVGDNTTRKNSFLIAHQLA